MKKITFLLILLSPCLFSQEDSTLAKNYRLDFSIPDHPAASILGSNSNNILKPSNSAELFSIITSNFFSSTTPILPKDISFEFSPAQLIGINQISLMDYRDNKAKRILYDAKISVAAKTISQDSLNNLGLGIRLIWVDKTALSQNKEFLNEATEALSKSLEAKKVYIENLKKNKIKINGIEINDLNLSEDNISRAIDSLFFADAKNSALLREFSLANMRQKYKNLTWNKFKFETSFAVKYSGRDSLIQNIHYSKFELYNTLAIPLGKRTTTKSGWGQMLVGLNFSGGKADSLRIVSDSAFTITDTIKYNFNTISLATRIYAGTNNFKTFIEGSAKYGSEELFRTSLNVGAEINIRDGIWAVLNFGNAWTKQMNVASSNWNSDWYWKLDLRFHLPEKKRI